jgi:death-on-curing protein
LNLLACGDPDIAGRAACHGVALARNHPFADGNKRAALLAVGLFLAVNGYRLSASPVEATLAMLAVAEGTPDEPGLAAWIRRHMALRRPAL